MVPLSYRLFDSFELLCFDWLVDARGEQAPEIAFVDISDATVQKIGRWPIPRGTLAQAIRKVAQGEPELIGLDVLLSERRAPEEDEAMATALSDAGNVVLAISYTEEAVRSEPLPAFRSAALDVAAVNLYLDSDGAVRRVPLAVRTQGFDYVGFAAVLATNYLNAPLKPSQPGIYSLGSRAIHFSADARRAAEVPSVVIAHWKAPGQRIDLHEVLEPGFVPAVLKGKIVIIGESSKAGKDTFRTPLYARKGLVSGPEIHAATLAALLEGRTVRALPAVLFWVVNLVVSLLAITLVTRGLRWVLPVTVLLGIAIYGLAWWLLAQHDIWLRWCATEFVMALSVAAGLGYGYFREGTRERELRRLFGQYVSGDVLSVILQNPQDIIEGQDRVASILFADIRGFTSTSAGKPPKDVIAWVNDYFEAMSQVIDANGGFLNKFMGDGLMVLFGAPVSEGEQEDAVRAVRTALQMLARLESLNNENAKRTAQGLWRPPVQIGLGIHTGPVAAGNVGSPRRMEYSVIGETVNLAARLESATRKFKGVDLVISPATERLVRERFVTEALGLADAKGFDEQVQVFTVRSERAVSSGGTKS